MDLKEFRKKWSKKADWKGKIRKLRRDIRKKYDQAMEELKLMKEFMELEMQP